MGRVLLDVDVEHQMSHRLPVALVSEAQRQEAPWCMAVDTTCEYDVHPTIGHHVDLAHEVLVRLLRLLPNPSVMHTNEKVNCVEMRQ